MSSTEAALSPILRALEGALGRTSRRPRTKAEKSADTFFAEGRLPIDELTISVKDLDPLRSPLPPATAQALHAASTPARHGQRDKTLLDKRVRDTGELRADRVALHWADGVRDALQAEVASALGLRQIEARLHNLLVYEPGQFFKPHQDTEKHPGMVGTLVLVWPSPHIGGELVVRHGSEQTHFASQHLNADTIRWCAFYADCRHEVLLVAEGWCVMLTFDLVPLNKRSAADETAQRQSRGWSQQMRPAFERLHVEMAFLRRCKGNHELRKQLWQQPLRSAVQASRATALDEPARGGHVCERLRRVPTRRWKSPPAGTGRPRRSGAASR